MSIGTLSQDPNSTLGRSGVYKTTGPSSSVTDSVDSPSMYELKSDLHPVCEFVEAESETDLGKIENAVDASTAELSMKAEVSLPMEKVPLEGKDKVKPKETEPDKDFEALNKSSDVFTSEMKENSEANVYEEEKSQKIEERVCGVPEVTVIENQTALAAKETPKIKRNKDEDGVISKEAAEESML